MITKEQIEHVFNIIEYENTYLLFLKTDTEKRELLATISADTFQIKKYPRDEFVEPKPNSIEILFNQINDYVLSLPYNFGSLTLTFDLLEYQINSYMYKCGFKFGNMYTMYKKSYSYTQKDVFGYEITEYEIILNYNNTRLTPTVLIEFVVYNSKSSKSTSFCEYVGVEVENNFDDIKKGISSILKPLFLKMGIELMQLSVKFEDVTDKSIVLNKSGMFKHKLENDTKKQKVFGKTMIDGDMRPVMKQQLLELANSL